MEVDKLKESDTKFPIVMSKGSDTMPTRFWSYILVLNQHELTKLSEKGFVISTSDTEMIQSTRKVYFK